ncbi:MAG: DUF2585 domain-containing protein [Pseudomonadota bacterium]
MEISRKYWLIVFSIFLVTVAILFAMERPPICTCGFVKLWEGEVNGPGNSQHIADWYTPSHMIHGMLFYALGWWLMRTRPIGAWLVMAVTLELAWEILENTPMTINRYREETMALAYSGDSILNSIADCGWMMTGFLIAARLPWKATAAIIAAFELFTLYMIRDNLTLNILMLVYPLEAIKLWQAGG